jgi:MoaA/NifB/PqqE/SkfB family radical SAM enzyme
MSTLSDAMSERAVAESSTSRQPELTNRAPTHHVYWRLLENCNFNCSYCFRDGIDLDRGRPEPDRSRRSPDQIAGLFDATGFRWRILLTGGEPFLYPEIIDLAVALTRKHELSVNTNLSTNNVAAFADSVSPRAVHTVYASLHPDEREKIQGGTARFLERILLLQDRGFNVRLVYVTYPPLLPRLLDAKERWERQGVRHFSIKTFRGVWDGKVYPRAFSAEERAFIRLHAISRYEADTVDERLAFFGRRCASGHTAFLMDPRGNLTRCNTIDVSHGNLFEGTVRFDRLPRPCPLPKCGCPYQGLRYVQPESAGWPSVLREALPLLPDRLLRRAKRALRRLT